MTDEEAFAQLQDGTPEGLEHFYIQYRQKCILWACKNLYWPNSGQSCDMEEATDLYQDAAIIFFDNARSGKLTELWATPSTYLISVIHNLWRNQNRRPPPDELPTKDIPDEPGASRDQIRHQVRKALGKMGEPCRTMLILRCCCGFSFDEIAAAMDYKNGAVVRNLISRCYKRFRDMFSLNPDDMDPYDPEKDMGDDLDDLGNLVPKKPKDNSPAGAGAAELPIPE